MKKSTLILGGVAVAAWYLSSKHEEDHTKPGVKPKIVARSVAVPTVVYQSGQDGFYAPAYNPYSYSQSYGYGYMSPQQCAVQGGLYDSFSNTCSSAGSNVAQAIAQPFNPYGYGGVIPNVVGLSLNVAIKVLNNAGFRVWVVQNESVYRGAPYGNDPGRVDLVISQGTVVSARVG